MFKSPARDFDSARFHWRTHLPLPLPIRRLHYRREHLRRTLALLALQVPVRRLRTATFFIGPSGLAGEWEHGLSMGYRLAVRGRTRTAARDGEVQGA